MYCPATPSPPGARMSGANVGPCVRGAVGVVGDSAQAARTRADSATAIRPFIWSGSPCDAAVRPGLFVVEDVRVIAASPRPALAAGRNYERPRSAQWARMFHHLPVTAFSLIRLIAGPGATYTLFAAPVSDTLVVA